MTEQEQEQKKTEALETYLAMRAIEREATEHREQAYADYLAAGGTHGEAAGAWLAWIYVTFIKQVQEKGEKNDTDTKECGNLFSGLF